MNAFQEKSFLNFLKINPDHSEPKVQTFLQILNFSIWKLNNFVIIKTSEIEMIKIG